MCVTTPTQQSTGFIMLVNAQINFQLSYFRIEMNWAVIGGNWKEFKGKQQQNKLTDEQLELIAGKHEHLAGKIQLMYGLSQYEAELQLSNWQSNKKILKARLVINNLV